ncbi:unnamed protein product [Malus baccata var. baccata]
MRAPNSHWYRHSHSTPPLPSTPSTSSPLPHKQTKDSNSQGNAAPNPTTNGVGTVPLRIPLSCPPPFIWGSTRILGLLLMYKGHQAHIPFVHFNWDLPKRLSRVRMEWNFELLANFPNFLHRLNNPNLVVHRHDRYEACIGPNRGAELVEVDKPVGLHRKVGHIVSLLLEMAAGIQNALVLRLGGDDVALLVLVEVHDALDRDVVALGGAGGKDDFFGGGAD